MNCIVEMSIIIRFLISALLALGCVDRAIDCYRQIKNMDVEQ